MLTQFFIGSLLCLYQWLYVAKVYKAKFTKEEMAEAYYQVAKIYKKSRR